MAEPSLSNETKRKVKEDFSLILGKSSEGRATVAELKLNREEAVNLRKALRKFGVHPPKR